MIRELNYAPDSLAKSLATQRTNMIGVVTATFRGSAMARTLDAAESFAASHGYHSLIAGAERLSRAEPNDVTLFRRQRVDGILIAYHGSEYDNYKLLSDLPGNIPVVTTGYAASHDGVITVRVDSDYASCLAVRHLGELGHRSIATITGPEGAYETVLRIRGYEQGLREIGVEPDPTIAFEGDWFVEGGYQATRMLLSSGRPFSAIFAHSDRAAIGCARALHEAGLRIPEDVSLVGFNDLDISGFLVPSLTTVKYPSFELGNVAVRVLIDAMSGNMAKAIPSEEELSRLRPYLVVRESTGPLPRNF